MDDNQQHNNPQNHQQTPTSMRDKLRHYLGDIIYGANDGIITTFTVVSGVVGAKLSPHIVIIIGFVSLLGDGFSMGASRYLSLRASSKVYGREPGVIEPLYHAGVTFTAFILLGAIPLFSYVLPSTLVTHYFMLSCIMTGFALFFTGSLRGLITKSNAIIPGLEMLGIGSLAALLAYLAGGLLAKLIAS